MKLADHQTMRLMTDETSAVEQAERRSKASVEDVRGAMEAALATTRSTAKEVSDRRWAEFGRNGPIGFRSGTDPEAKLEVECGVPVSHESRETVNQTKQTSLALNQETHNYKPNHCKQITRNSVKLAESHRLFTVENKERTRRLSSREIKGMIKLSSDVQEREQININGIVEEVPSRVGRIPIKVIGTDIEGNDLELSFRMEGDPIFTDQTQINIKPHKTVQSNVKPHKTTSNHIKPHKTTQNNITPHKTTQNHIKPHKGKVVVLTDVPPGPLSIIAQTQDGVNTVGPVPMIFGYGPNTFPHSAAHVPNTNLSPSRSEGDPNIDFSAHKSVPKLTCFTLP